MGGLSYPDKIEGRALQTFQRRISEWLRRHGPPKEVFFAQVHKMGECIQTDWINANELGVTIAGVAFAHLLCHSVLPLKRGEGRRGFNVEFAALCKHLKHLDMESRTIAVASPNQNGDVEAAQGVVKRRIKNQLILRRSRDFGSLPAYAVFLA